ncbi:MAG: hypothetical protein KDC66_12920 [Phaeodactylibacter sp.]|nr:hypothetical protein [Phaeodactylibacter sp.]MCB9273975.1 hypothetical protein [Lewinellaceae bacterium]
MRRILFVFTAIFYRRNGITRETLLSRRVILKIRFFSAFFYASAQLFRILKGQNRGTQQRVASLQGKGTGPFGLKMPVVCPFFFDGALIMLFFPA